MVDKCDDTRQAPILRIAVLEERLKGRDDALKLQAAEYERRLDELNHSHSLATQRYAEFMPRTDFDKFAAELREWRTGIDKQIASDTGSKTTFISFAGFVLSLTSLAAVLYGIYLS